MHFANLDKLPRLNIRKRVDEDFCPQDLVRVDGAVVLQSALLQLDHVVEGRANHFPEESVLVVQLHRFTHGEEKLEGKKETISYNVKSTK